MGANVNRPIQEAVRLYSWDSVASLLTQLGITWNPDVTTPPASAVAAGVVGNVAFDATHFYVCIAANTWVRCTLATW